MKSGKQQAQDAIPGHMGLKRKDAGVPFKKRKAAKTKASVNEDMKQPAAVTQQVQQIASQPTKRSDGPSNSKPPISEEERSRREYQKQMRELSLKLKAEGKQYNRQEHKFKSQPPKTQSSQAQPKGKKRKNDWTEKHGTTTEAALPKTDVQVVIIPIFWNTRKEEKTKVLAAAANAEEALKKVGLTIHTDIGNHKTPGQKMHYWEQRGVRVRVELGPRDVIQRTCIVAIPSTPGSVASKQTVRMAELPSKVLAALTPAASGEDTPENGTVAEQAEPAVAVETATEGGDRARKRTKKSDAHARASAHADVNDSNAAEPAASADELDLAVGAGVQGTHNRPGKKHLKSAAGGPAGPVEVATKKLNVEIQATGTGAANPASKKTKKQEHQVAAAAHHEQHHAADPALGKAKLPTNVDAHQRKQAKMTSGDDLGDDFGIEFEREEDKAMGVKPKRFDKKMFKQKRAAAKGGNGEEDEARQSMALAKKHKPKLVVF